MGVWGWGVGGRIMSFLLIRDNNHNNNNSSSSSSNNNNNNITIMNSARVLYQRLHSRMQARQVSNFIPHLRNNDRPPHSILLIGRGVVGYDFVLSVSATTHIFILSLAPPPASTPMRNYFILPGFSILHIASFR